MDQLQIFFVIRIRPKNASDDGSPLVLLLDFEVMNQDDYAAHQNGYEDYYDRKFEAIPVALCTFILLVLDRLATSCEVTCSYNLASFFNDLECIFFMLVPLVV